MVRSGLFATLLATAAARNFSFSEKVHTFSNESIYETGYDSRTGALYITSAIGAPPVHNSTLIKFDLESWTQVEAVKPRPCNGTEYQSKASLYAVYGIKIDEETGYVWVTNPRQSTFAVYDGSDLSLIKQFPVDSSPHASFIDFYKKDIYVTTAAGKIDIFDRSSYEKKGSVSLNTTGKFENVMQPYVDQNSGVLYTVSLNTPTAAAIDLENGNKVTYYDLGSEIEKASGVAYDSKRKHLFVVSQGNNETVVLDTNSGDVIKRIPTDATGLSALYEPVYDLVYYNSQKQGVTVVIDAETLEVVTTLQSGIDSNHISAGPNGTIFVTNRIPQPPTKLHAYTPHAISNSSNSSSAGAGKSGVVTSLATASPSTEAVGTTKTANATYFTTYCPSPTTFAYGSSTYTVTEATTLSIEDCGCTKNVSSSGLGPATSGAIVASASTSAPAVANAATGSFAIGVSGIVAAIVAQLI